MYKSPNNVQYMKELLDQPELNKFATTFSAGHVLFRENEDSQDLYILISGKLDVFKGNKNISELTEPGSLCGEMSFLLRSKRTATVVARHDSKVICIPSDKIKDFLHEFPILAREITSILATRLNETTNVMHGLKAFCDQLPDAVIMTDTGHKILAWNTAAEKLYGRPWRQMRNKKLDEIYDNQATFKQFLDDMSSQKTVKEKILKINHPSESWKFVSTNTTVLYDTNEEIQGYLLLGRDVTETKKIEEKHKRTRNWYLLIIAVFAVLLAGQIWSKYIPSQEPPQESATHKIHPFDMRISRDYLGLSFVLSRPFQEGDVAETTRLIEEYFTEHDPGKDGIIGLLLLDKDKTIVNFFSSRDDQQPLSTIGNSYSGVKFDTENNLNHKGPIIFIVSSDEKTQSDMVELAYKMYKTDEFLGWLVFQLDLKTLANKYELDIKHLAFLSNWGNNSTF